ncbi:MAG: hypothetical protein ACNA8W_08730 [Bradymonadaceae bacterium]
MLRSILALCLLGLVMGCPSETPNEQDVGSERDEDVSSDVPTAPDVRKGLDTESDTGPEELGTHLRFDPAMEDFFDVPFPSDLRRGPEGLGFSEWPGAMRNHLLRLWFDAAEDLGEGWGLVSGIFLYFTDALDESTLPGDIASSLIDGERWPSVFLIDVDDDSPDRGHLLPIECKFTAPQGTLHAAHQLACISPLGVVRRGNTRYAFVLTDEVHDSAGEPLQRGPAMSALLAGSDVTGRHGDVLAVPYRKAVELIEELGGPADTIVAMNLFTTGDPTARLRRVNTWYQTLPDPVIDEEAGLELVEVYDDYIVLAGYYEVPVIQRGSRPYSNPPAGNIIWDEAGNPELVDQQRIRFYITVPRAAMGADGYATMLYLHGSGGVAEELMNRGARPDVDTESEPGSGPASTLAHYGLAGFAADFNLHGMRHDPPDTSGLMLYNLLGNPRAAIDNFIIGANEITLHARLLANLAIDPAVAPEYLDPGEAADGLIRFDSARFSAMGQSMGSTIGLPAMTIDHRIDAAVFSGSGGVLIEVALTGTRPLHIKPVLHGILGYRNDEVLDRFDPILSAVQYVWDFVDPIVHGRHVFLEPHEGVKAKHVLQHSGLEDGYFSPLSRAAFSSSMGVELVEPVVEPYAREIMGWNNVGEALVAPVQGNRPGNITGVVLQYEPSVLDGHNVGFQRDDTRAQYGCFLRSVLVGEAPILRSVEDSSAEACP